MVVIAISGRPGAGSSSVAKALANELNLGYFSPGEKFFKPSGKNGTTESLNTWKGEGKDKKFHLKIDEYQKELAKKGDIVICGKLSIWILRDIADLKVWLDCDFEERVRRSSIRDMIPIEEAKKKLKERENIEEKEWKKMYGFNRNIQKKMADMVIDTTNLTIQEVVERIKERLNYE
ncbi:MAG: cytidylate kinase family protein [Candidatus Aenigmatarchaeota archaeon]